MIREWWAKITAPAKIKDQFPVQQLTYLGRIADATIVFPYGFYANISRETLGIMISLGKGTESKVVLGVAAPDRPDLAEGEVGMYSPTNPGTFIIFDKDGNIKIETTKDITTKCVNATVEASTKLTVTTPVAEFSGNVKIGGDLEVVGDIEGENVKETATGIDLGTHTHLGSPTAPSGIVSNTGAPQ